MKNVFKVWGFWTLVLIFLEVSFKLIMNLPFQVENLINIFLHSIILSAIFSMLSGIFTRRTNYIIVCVILFIFGILFSTQCIFYKVFKTYFSLTNLGLSDQLNSFLGETVKIVLKNLIYVLVFMLPLIVTLVFKRKLKFKRYVPNDYLIYFIILVIASSLFTIHALSTKGKINSTYYLYRDVNEVSLNINKFGVLHSYDIDLYRLVFGFNGKIIHVNVDDYANNEDLLEEQEKVIEYTSNTLDLDFSKNTNNGNITKINDYVSNDSGTFKNEYTGLFEGYNLVYITAESFSELGVSKELTPTLYKLINTGFIFDNYYTPNVLSTIGGEFQSLTGLYPDSAILPKWRSGTNYFPYGLATVFKTLGYNTFAYHDNSYVFQDRNKYLQSQGFDNFLACYNGLEKRMNCNLWPESDVEMINVTLPDYINSSQPFLAYYMTVSGHFEYTFSDNYIAYKNREYVKDLNLPEGAKAYIATQIELDKALELLINELENAGKLDKTVFVLLADHYPYELDTNSVNSLSTYDRDEVVEVNHNALIIWNNTLDDKHISKPCMSADVLPTVYNLFGVDYDSRLFAGRDILSTSLGIAIFRNRSWVSEYGTYYANSNNFVAKKDVPEGYVDNINSLVNSRLNVSKMIVENNYYNYLFNE